MQQKWTRRQMLSLVVSAGASVGIATLTGCGGSSTSDTGTRRGYLYVTTNTPGDNQNSVLQYERHSDGTLVFVRGYATGGAGVDNQNNLAGPHDGDYDLIASADNRFLFALNSGSDTIAVFRIQDSGSLTAVTGSPFPAGGKNPVSMNIVNGRLYVANMNSDPSRPGGTANYTIHTIGSEGQLTLLSDYTVNATEAPQALPPFFFANSAGPTLVLPSPDGTVLYTSLFFPGQITTHAIGADGRLSASPGTPQVQADTVAPANAAFPTLKIAVNGSFYPSTTQRILYVHFTTFSQIGVYTYDTTGQLTFVRAAANSRAGVCWSRITRDGRTMYAMNTFDASFSVYDLADPLNPVEVQTVSLPLTNGESPANVNSLRFNISPQEDYLYAETQRLNTDPAIQTGNAIHVIRIEANRRLTVVDSARVNLPVPANTRPQGILAL